MGRLIAGSRPPLGRCNRKIAPRPFAADVLEETRFPNVETIVLLAHDDDLANPMSIM